MTDPSFLVSSGDERHYDTVVTRRLRSVYEDEVRPLHSVNKTLVSVFSDVLRSSVLLGPLVSVCRDVNLEKS